MLREGQAPNWRSENVSSLTSNTARLTMGLRPVPLGRMKREIRIIQALLRGEEVMHDCEGEQHLIKLLHRDQGFINLEQPIPLTLSAFGEKTLAYCGAECDAHLTWNPTPESLPQFVPGMLSLAALAVALLLIVALLRWQRAGALAAPAPSASPGRSRHAR